MSIGKVLGFLGLTSDVTGFELEPSILAVGLVVSVVLQLLKDNTEVNIEYKDGHREKVQTQTSK
jgi:hypothetical protein